MKKKLMIIILFVLFIIILFIGYRKNIIKIFNDNKSEQTIKSIIFQLYSNENDILKILVIVEDKENGIEKVTYPLKDGTKMEISCYSKNKVAIDYEIDKNGNYEFIAINKAGEEIKKTLVIDDEYRNTLINIQVSTQKEIDTSGKVKIVYPENERAVKSYKIGEHGQWIEYTGEFEINSYDIIENNLVDTGTKTLNIYAKAEDEAKNIVLMQKKISNIDIDIAENPVATYVGSERMPELRQYGIALDEEVRVDIQFDQRTDITNYYSLNNGYTWEKYNGTLQTDSPYILVKSVKNDSGLEIVKKYNCNDILQTTALQAWAYDSDYDSGTGGIQQKYVIVSDEMKGKEFTIKWHVYFYTTRVTFLDENKEQIKIVNGSIGTPIVETIQIPENATYMVFDAAYTILEINTLNKPKIVEEQFIYPKLTQNGVEKPYTRLKLEYYITSIQQLYKIDNSEWQDYDGGDIKLELGETLYVKGIDLYGNETQEIEYKSVLATDAINENAYDGNETTAHNIGTGNSTYYRMDISSEMIGKKVYISAYSYGQYFGAAEKSYIIFYDELGAEISEIEIPGNIGFKENIDIPSNATNLKITTKGYWNTICNIKEIKPE